MGHNGEIARYTGLKPDIVDILEVILVQYYDLKISNADIDMLASELGIEPGYIRFTLGYYYHTL